MGLFSKHTPAPARDPRPKGADWRVGNGRMLRKLLTDKEFRRAENEAARAVRKMW